MNAIVDSISLIVGFVDTVLGNFYILFVVECCSVTVKLYLLYRIGNFILCKKKQQWAFFLLLVVLAGALSDDIAWLVILVRKLFIPSMTYACAIGVLRIAWALLPITWYVLGFFLETLADPHHKIRWYQKISMIATACVSGSFIYFFITDMHVATWEARPAIEIQLIRWCPFYCLIVIVPSLIIVLYKLWGVQLPKIVQRQLTLFMRTIIVPLVLIELCDGVIIARLTDSARYTFTNCYTILMTCAIYYVSHKIMNMRFLNLNQQVHDARYGGAAEEIKEMVEYLSAVSNRHELTHLIQSFFKHAFGVPVGRVQVLFRTVDSASNVIEKDAYTLSENACTVEHFITQTASPALLSYVHKTSVLIFDEAAFSAYYERDVLTSQVLQFLKSINADVFIPLYNQDAGIIGYIVVERDARVDVLYSDRERDQMLIFSRFVANVFALLNSQRIESLVASRKDLRLELHQKKSELAQCKESMRSLLNMRAHQKIGLLFYKNRTFLCANQEAQELIQINPNVQEGHPLSRDLRMVVKAAQTYQTTQTCFSCNDEGRRLVLTAFTNLEAHNIIVMVHYGDGADAVKKHLDSLQDASEWDYVLYLETTQAGKLINTVLPGSSKQLLAIKIALLKGALSSQAAVIQASEKDLNALVELIHHMSARQTLHVLKLERLIPHDQLSIMLFGINPLFGRDIEQPVFEKLRESGTLFIQHIHNMDHQTQRFLADYLTYGYYQRYKSEQYRKSDVRIICSSYIDLAQLVRENKIIPELYERLKHMVIEIPSLLTLGDDDLKELAQGCAVQLVQYDGFRQLLALTDKEKQKLIDKKSASISEFKQQVQRLLEAKTHKTHIDHTVLTPQYDIVDPELLEAARLGKHALRDPRMVAFLWDKFKNQNKIATFLGVNRSSVNRRCKEYGIF